MPGERMGDSSRDSQYGGHLKEGGSSGSKNITCNGSSKPGQTDNWRMSTNEDSGNESGRCPDKTS